ncbi:hypothetical protein CH282_27975 [Rhodococcus sp. 06-418-1B]|nr:hypothetical protein CH282_27975 [Rhodococcus sp. 06-418-1B]
MIDPVGCVLGCFPTLPIRTPTQPRAVLGPRIQRSAGSTPASSGRSAGSTPASSGRSAGSTPASPGRSAGSTPARRLLFVGGAK